MKKYNKPSVEIEKFTVADIITQSNYNVDIDMGDVPDAPNAVTVEVGDEF